MHNTMLFWLVGIGTALTVMVVILLATHQHFFRIVRTVEQLLILLRRIGEGLRRFKDDRLEPLTDWIPASADAQTVLRFVALGISLDYVRRDNFGAAAMCFIFGWVLDLTDGMTARRRAKLPITHRLHQQPTRFGKYADPFVDVPYLVAFGFMLAPVIHPPLLAQVFAWTVVARIGLYLLYWALFSTQIRLGILPQTVEGQYKTVFVVVAFGLVLIDSDRSFIRSIPEVLIGAAVLLEPGSLVAQIKRVWRLRHAPAADQSAKIDIAP